MSENLLLSMRFWAERHWQEPALSPEKQRTINFYGVNDMMYVVDLPGYGYAKVPKSEVAKWGQMMEEYLTRREELRAIILLIGIRHEPGKNDIMMYDWLKHFGFDIIIAATKSDKLNRSQIPKQLAVIRKTLKLQPQDVLIPFSGEKKTGVEELWAEIEKFLPGGEKRANLKRKQKNKVVIKKESLATLFYCEKILRFFKKP